MINQNTAFILILFAFISLGFVLIRYKQILLGFTIFTFINISSASFSAFLVNYTFKIASSHITDEHIWVFISSALGLIAFSFGVYLAWHPLASHRANGYVSSRNFPWLNEHFGFLCIVLGASAYLLIPIAYSVPTLRAVWSTYIELLKFGVLLILVYAKLYTRNRILFPGLIIFSFIVAYQALNSGHIGAGGTFLIQMLLVWSFSKKGITLPGMTIFLAGIVLLFPIFAGWMESRVTIRSGGRDGIEVQNRAALFINSFKYANPLELSVDNVYDLLRTRIDMSDILAAQVIYQPSYQPYAFGGTIFQSLSSALVPRFIWPNKPSQVGGSDFVSRYTGLYWSSETSVGLPYQFELYANGGVIGVVGGLFCIGWLLARLELTLFSRRHTIASFLSLLVVVNAIANGAQTITSLIMTIIAGVIGVIILSRVLVVTNRRLNFWHSEDYGPKAQFDSIDQQLHHWGRRLSQPLMPSRKSNSGRQRHL